jgi:hypothetical protein
MTLTLQQKIFKAQVWAIFQSYHSLFEFCGDGMRVEPI